MRRTASFTRQSLFRFAGLVIALVFSYPLWWLLFASLRPDYQPLTATPLADDFGLMNYRTAFELVPLARFLFNSTIVTATAVTLTLLVSSLAGYAISQIAELPRRLLLWVSLAALVLPPTALWLTRFPVFKALGWIDTWWPLLAPALIGGNSFTVLLCYWAFRRLSPEMLDAARLAGASEWQIWRQIALPLALPTLVVAGILAGILFWGNFTDPLLYLRRETLMTLPVGVRLLAQLDSTRWGVLMAGAVVLTLPPLLVLLIGQRFLWQVVDEV